MLYEVITRATDVDRFAFDPVKVEERSTFVSDDGAEGEHPLLGRAFQHDGNPVEITESGQVGDQGVTVMAKAFGHDIDGLLF